MVVSECSCARASHPNARPFRSSHRDLLPMVVAMPASCVRHIRYGLVWAGAEPAEMNQQQRCSDQWAKNKGRGLISARLEINGPLVAQKHSAASLSHDPRFALLAPRRLDFQRPRGPTEERGKPSTKGGQMMGAFFLG